MSDIRIYVACLSAYNSGKLHGTWIDIDPKSWDRDEVKEGIAKMLKESPEPGAEEWGIHDTEGLPFGGEPTLEEVFTYCELVSQHGQDLVDAAIKYESLVYAEESIENFRGCYASAEDYCQEMLEERISCHVPKHDKHLSSLVSEIVNLIDWEHAVGEAENNGIRFVEHNHDVYVFGE